jgi:hypothetical protein
MIRNNPLKQPVEFNSPHSLFGVMASGKLTAVPEFESMYESFNPLTTVNKQHFVEWFSGSVLDSIWTVTDLTGSNSSGMSDTVDGGYNITTGATSGNTRFINFNNKRQYSHNSSVMICIMKRNGEASHNMGCGFSDDNAKSYSDTGTFNFSMVENRHALSTVALKTADGTTPSRTQGSEIGRTTTWHSHKIVNGASNVILTNDGVEDVVKTTNLPTAKMQPIFSMQGTASATASGNVRYMECYNT